MLEKKHVISKYIASIYRKSKNEFNKCITHLDVRATQSDLLLFIFEHPDCSQKQIAKQMTIDPSLLTRDLRKLELDGLLTRTHKTDDGRLKRINLTLQGLEIAQELYQIMDNWWETFFENNPNINSGIFIEQLKLAYQSFSNIETDDSLDCKEQVKRK